MKAFSFKLSLLVTLLAMTLVSSELSAATRRPSTPSTPTAPSRPSRPRPQPPVPNPTPAPVPAPSQPTGSLSNLETCFSPDEGCDQKLIALINSAQSTLDIAIYSIAHNGIANAIIAAKNRGVNVRMVVDRSQSNGAHSETGTLSNSSVPLKIGNVTGIMHDKYTIVDGTIMETGSFNYSENATANNAENQIYLTDRNVITRYQTNFEKLWSEGLAK